ncbi:TIGR00730 family Rossman fold protein [Candidatus Pacearchaeota archaeon]|nr:TIGR00730 family Rossman fold protein [Candidatus Pacearchaeota archaeon]
MANICAYSSAKEVNEKYIKVAEQLGKLIGGKGYNLVYGGGNDGLMGVVAKAVRENGGKVISVVPKIWADHPSLKEFPKDEVIITDNFRSRREKMAQISQGFIILPGALGTLAEATDIIEDSDFISKKPISLINCYGFFNNFLAQDIHAIKEGFALRPINLHGLHISTTLQEAFDFIEQRLK